MRSPLRSGVLRLRQDRAAMLGLGFIGMMALLAVFAPFVVKLVGHPPNATSVEGLTETGLPNGRFGGVGLHHLFGVEPSTGRDVFSRIVYGTRVSLGISLSATALTIVLGGVIGAAAGFFPGKLDMGLSRFMDLLLAFPGLLFIITLIGAVPENFPRPLLIVLVLGGLGWPYIGRLVRTLVMGLRERDFVDAARASGASEWRILVREVLPNLSGPMLTYATLVIPGYVISEAALSYLGLGVRVPTSSWGDMLATASSYYQADPTYLIIPGVTLFLTVYAFNVLGDGLSAAFNPSTRR